ncbi:MAG: hypothetical protein U0744_02665 [Gemmataceae bacterium]
MQQPFFRSLLDQVRRLRTMIPMCAWCDQIRDSAGNWMQLSTYLRSELKLKLTHGICPDCSTSAMREGPPTPHRP